MSHRFAVVAEAPADHTIATELADRVLLETLDNWLDEDLLPHQREWVIEFAGGRFSWTGIRNLADAKGIQAEGHFDGARGLPDAQAARRALRYLRSTLAPLDAVVLIRDQDDQDERRGGLEQARREDHEGLVIVVGLAVVEREAWVISGFEPKDEAEQARLDAERQRLGFYPYAKSHELWACKDDKADRSPKRVLRKLCGDDPHRERSCWTETPLARLRERGSENGLAAYLDEVRNRLAPLIGHVPGVTEQ